MWQSVAITGGLHSCSSSSSHLLSIRRSSFRDRACFEVNRARQRIHRYFLRRCHKHFRAIAACPGLRGLSTSKPGSGKLTSLWPERLWQDTLFIRDHRLWIQATEGELFGSSAGRLPKPTSDPVPVKRRLRFQQFNCSALTAPKTRRSP